MPKINMQKTHSLTTDQAREKVNQLAASLKDKYGLSGSWAGNRYEFKRTGVTGFVKLEEKKVSVEVDLSFVLSPLKGKVEEAVRQKLDQEFA
ncbi:MAG: hypothetical protein GYA21_00950 [Myxococcales bacterium]|nr:hypothetical protein [Myxococcales bacterium]